MTPLRIPHASITMEEAQVVRWLVRDGATVHVGQPVVEIETDKSVLEVDAPAEGVLRILADIDSRIPVGGTIAEIRNPDEPDGISAVPEATLEGQPQRKAWRIDPDAQRSPLAAPQSSIPASPAARRLAREHGIALERISATRPDGRIVAADVERAIAATGGARPTVPAEATPRRSRSRR